MLYPLLAAAHADASSQVARLVCQADWITKILAHIRGDTGSGAYDDHQEARTKDHLVIAWAVSP